MTLLLQLWLPLKKDLWPDLPFHCLWGSAYGPTGQLLCNLVLWWSQRSIDLMCEGWSSNRVSVSMLHVARIHGEVMLEHSTS